VQDRVVPRRARAVVPVVVAVHVVVDGRFTGPDVLQAIDGHVLAKAAIAGTYTLNPRLA
jgi:phosphatidylethanolamine-binding protein (PEBP) family uncharacterized protein